MDVVAILNELRKELERIDTLILALDSLQSGRRRGRPPKLLQELRSGARLGRTKTEAAQPAGKKARKRAKKRRRRKAAKKAILI